jgi:hypothetical protein
MRCRLSPTADVLSHTSDAVHENSRLKLVPAHAQGVATGCAGIRNLVEHAYLALPPLALAV